MENCIFGNTLKGPKHEIFVTGIFSEIRPVRVADLETRPKNLKSLCLGPYITHYFWDFCFSAVGYSAKKIKNWSKKKFFLKFQFLVCLKSAFAHFKNLFSLAL